MFPASRLWLLLGILFSPTLVPVQAAGDAPVVLTVRRDQPRQSFDGFGTAITTWFPAYPPYYQQESFQRFYLEELGATVLRVDLWGESVPEREDWRDISYRDFVLRGEGERAGISLALARQLHARAPGQFRVIGSVWSPPPWMKVNGRRGNGRTDRQNRAINFDNPAELGLWRAPLPDDPTGERYEQIGRNKLRGDRYLHFAKTLVEWTRLYRHHGLDFHALSPQNEPRFSQWYESSVYTPQEYAELLRVIDWMFRHEREPKPLIFGPEHMTGRTSDNRKYLEAALAQPHGSQYLDVLASHGYTDGVQADGTASSAAAFAQFGAHYGKPLWFTEGGTGPHTWPEALHGIGLMTMNALTVGRASLLTPWQIAEAEPSGHSLMGFSGPTKKTFVAMHYYRHIRPGMTRVPVDGQTEELRACAYVSGDSEKVVVVLLQLAEASAPVELRDENGRALAVAAGWRTDRTHDFAQHAAWQEQEQIELNGPQIVTLQLVRGVR